MEISPELLGRCREGDEGAWRQLFAAVYPLAVWAASGKKYRFEHHVARDMAQEAMIAVANNINKIGDERHLRGFVVRVVGNKCADRLRGQKNAFHEELDENIAADPAADGLGEEALAALGGAVARLDERCARIIKSRFLMGESYKEIAAALDIPVNQVGVYLSRCLTFLKNSMIKRGFSPKEFLR